jgi:hypothetical protein
MRNVGSCQWSLLGRLLMFATRNAGCPHVRRAAEQRRDRRDAAIMTEGLHQAA